MAFKTWSLLYFIIHRTAMTIACFVSAMSVCASSGKPPSSFVDEGACPFECCTYREWTVEADTLLLVKPEDPAKIIGKARKGTKVRGLTGIVIVTKPGQIEVLRPHTGESGRTYKPGDTVWVYTERGEGFFRVWYNGEIYDEEASFMYQDRGGQERCVDEGTCWGKRRNFPLSVWWVKVKISDGTVGWSKTPENFGNIDACG
ncbi:MAG: hypothetical protein RKP20_02835 [Candidatus Competibacter sp.]|nr:hypothetical protein [Candidatus Competibacter sp.]